MEITFKNRLILATARRTGHIILQRLLVNWDRLQPRYRLSMSFKYNPNWHLTLIDETVDVAKSGDMATYRGTYAEDSLHDGVPFTHKGNYVAGFRRDGDGLWRVHWSVVAWQSPSKKKG